MSTLSIEQLSNLIFQALDRNNDHTIDRGELDHFAKVLEKALERLPNSDRSSLWSIDAPAAGSSHDLKVLVNDTLVAATRNLGLTLITVPGANYPAVAELRPRLDGQGRSLPLTSEQVAIRKQLTSLVAEMLKNDPRMPEGLEIEVENPYAASGADRLAFRWYGGEPLIFDVITGKGILKSRVAVNYLSEKMGLSEAVVRQRQVELMGAIESRLG